MRELPEWAKALLTTPRADQAIEVFMSEPEEGVAKLFRIYLLHAFIEVRNEPPAQIEDPLLRLMVRLGDERVYSLGRDDSLWVAFFSVLRDNGPRYFGSWLNSHLSDFYMDDADEYRAFVYENDEGELVDRFPELQDRMNAVRREAEKALARAQAGSSAQKSGGCYVATYVYGTYDCPELWALRRWRDESLQCSPVGRAFIRAYYAVSPVVIARLGGSRNFHRISTFVVNRVVQRLVRRDVPMSAYVDLHATD